jgi:hypothetical protein
METQDDVLRLLVVMARAAALAPYVGGEESEPQIGDLVVEVSHQTRDIDPDAIGWLVGHGSAPYREDGTGPAREVWDILPLSGRGQKRYPERTAVDRSAMAIDDTYQRWENAEFRKVPEPLRQRAGLHPPLLPA